MPLNPAMLVTGFLVKIAKPTGPEVSPRSLTPTRFSVTSAKNLVTPAFRSSAVVPSKYSRKTPSGILAES